MYNVLSKHIIRATFMVAKLFVGRNMITTKSANQVLPLPYEGPRELKASAKVSKHVRKVKVAW